jgi:hypothetical protein
VPIEDRRDRAAEGVLVRRGEPTVLEQLVHGDDEPQGRIHAVELRLGAAIRETIRQHPLRDRSRPFDQDVARVVVAVTGEADAAQRDERVATPVGEPRIAGDDRLAAAAPHDVGVGGAMEA